PPTHVAHTAGDHDRLVVAANAFGRIARRVLLESPEIATNRGPAELVIERSSADWPLDHDVERGGNTFGLAKFPSSGSSYPSSSGRGDGGGGLPRAKVPWNFQMRGGKPDQPGLRLRAAPRRAFIPNLTSRARSRAGEWRDRRGVVVCLHLHQD